MNFRNYFLFNTALSAMFHAGEEYNNQPSYL